MGSARRRRSCTYFPVVRNRKQLACEQPPHLHSVVVAVVGGGGCCARSLRGSDNLGRQLGGFDGRIDSLPNTFEQGGNETSRVRSIVLVIGTFLLFLASYLFVQQMCYQVLRGIWQYAAIKLEALGLQPIYRRRAKLGRQFFV